jgi:ubiquinone biosynthesis monooxygenase Coq7
MKKHTNPLDSLINHLDSALRTIGGAEGHGQRANPAEKLHDTKLDDTQKKLVSGLMRINHAGEIAAQGLYQGQSLTAKLPEVREAMDQAAQEETDHLNWCHHRLNELNSHRSLLNPLWYTGAFGMGALTGLIGDKWSLGFVAETEKQVVSHLDKHLQRLPVHDGKSRAILQQMKSDEQHHATTALDAGGAELPAPAKILMKGLSKVMTLTAFRL